MPVIYFNNFRGFEKTFLPLANVNFFVGENSSGKTSILKLIKILSDQKFWFSQLFSSDEADLGYYSEIASVSAKKKYFEVGILVDNKEKYEGITAVKFKFIDKEGIPVVNELSMIINDVNIQVIVEGELLKYRYGLIDTDKSSKIEKIKFFRSWAEKNNLTSKFHKNLEDNFMSRSPLVFHVQNIVSNLKRDGKIKSRVNFEIPSFLQEMTWIAPIRIEPKRTYDSHKLTFNPDGTHVPYLLKKLLNEDKQNKVKHILQKFGKDSGLFDNISINPLGKDQTSPFELEVTLNNQNLKITNVGYGVSQVLPLLVEIIARPNKAWFAIQQPEIHLHPRGQAAFGDLILMSTLKEKKNFIIETHSDFTIDRYRIKLNKIDDKEKLGNLESQIVFFLKKDGKNTLKCLPIYNDGNVGSEHPDEFREFFIREQLELLSV